MKRTPILWIGLLSISFLTACDGSSGGGDDPDNFIDTVENVINNNTSDSIEPFSLDNFPPADLSEDSEPQAL